MRGQMREETRIKLEREFWRRRLMWGLLGLAGAVLFGGVFYLTNLDATVDEKELSGTVDEVERFVPSKGGPEGWRVGVKLSDGRRVNILAGKDNEKHAGEPIQVTEHHHHTGRSTFTAK